MTNEQFFELKKQLDNINATLSAGFAVMVGLQQAAIMEKNIGKPLSTEEWMTAVHDGLDTFFMLKDNAVQELAKESEDKS